LPIPRIFFCALIRRPARLAASPKNSATKGIPRKVNKLALTALRLAAARQAQTVTEAMLLEAAGEALW